MEANHPATKPQSPATQETTTTPQTPVFDEEQLAAVDRLVAKAVARLEDAHRKEKTSLQEQLDAASNGTLDESDALTRLRAERDEARADATRLQDEKRRQQVLSNFRRVWRDEGLPENRVAMAELGNAFVSLDDSGEPVVLDNKGKPRHGVTLKEYARELKSKYFSNSESGAATPSNPSGIKRSKDDFTRAEKIDYITKFGLKAWEDLAVRSPEAARTSPADDVLNWSNERKGDFIREHGSAALSERLRKARERRSQNYFKG
jgi:hypothetical protein